MNKYVAAFKATFPLTLPICAAFLFLGLSYGFYMCSKGFSFWYPFFTSALVFAGSMEFVLVTMLLSPFNPLYCFFMTLMINSRHLFYGLSMLEKYKNVGWKNIILFLVCATNLSLPTAQLRLQKAWTPAVLCTAGTIFYMLLVQYMFI